MQNNMSAPQEVISSEGNVRFDFPNHQWLWANKPHEATNFHGLVALLQLAASTMDSVVHRANGHYLSCLRVVLYAAQGILE